MTDVQQHFKPMPRVAGAAASARWGSKGFRPLPAQTTCPMMEQTKPEGFSALGCWLAGWPGRRPSDRLGEIRLAELGVPRKQRVRSGAAAASTSMERPPQKPALASLSRGDSQPRRGVALGLARAYILHLC